MVDDDNGWCKCVVHMWRVCQVLGMAMATVFFAAVGFLNPANRGSLMVGIVLLFLFMGAIGGYKAARTHKVC